MKDLSSNIQALAEQIKAEVEKAPKDLQINIINYVTYDLQRHFYEKEKIDSIIKKLKEVGVKYQ